MLLGRLVDLVTGAFEARGFVNACAGNMGRHSWANRTGTSAAMAVGVWNLFERLRICRLDHQEAEELNFLLP